MGDSPRTGDESRADDPPAAPAEPLRAMQDRIADKMFGRRGDPKRFGRYVILDPLGEGGLGSVYAAYDPELDRKVAIKIVRLGTAAPEHHRTRLLREAQALAKLSHPNVVQVFDVGAVDDEVFVAMELVRGQTLREWIEHASLDYWFRDGGARDAAGRRPLVRRTKIVPLTAPRAWREILDVFLDAGRGLAAAHATGLIHRDFKPENVMVDRDGRARVLDFGLARSVRAAESGATESEACEPQRPALDASLTRTGTVMGTPAYMAPEQHRGGKVDERSDQFGFCVALYESLYGKRPFYGSTRAEIAFAMNEGEMQRPRDDTDVPPGLLEIIARGLKPDPRERHASMDDLLVALQRFSAAPRRHSRTWRIAAGSAIVLGLAAWPASALLREDAPPPVAQPEDACGDETLELEALEAMGRWEATVAAEAGAQMRARIEELRAVRARVCELSPDLRRHRQACVDQRALEFHALTDALGSSAVAHASEAVRLMGDPGACMDRREDGSEIANAKTVAGEAAIWAIAYAEGDFARAMELARAASERAETTGDRVALAEATLRLGHARLQMGEPAAEVVHDLVAVAAIAEDADRPDLAAWAWLALAREAEHPEGTAAFLEVARTAVERAGQPRDLVQALADLERSPR